MIFALWADIAAAPARARWVAYGDSITQGWTVTHPSAAWPALAAREAGLDLVNLGFAGAARSEHPVAAYLASLPADVITFSWGTNCWAQIEMDASYIAEWMRMFLATVRRGHPHTPILVLSRILRPQAETVPNAAGSTLQDLRGAIEDAVITYSDSNHDENVHLLSGAGLVPGATLVDGIHPDDDGHKAMGAAAARELTRILER